MPAKGLVDAWGNTSGAAKTLTIGQVEEQAWPPVMPVGGFCVPSAFGKGCFWPDALFPWPPGKYPPGHW